MKLHLAHPAIASIAALITVAVSAAIADSTAAANSPATVDIKTSIPQELLKAKADCDRHFREQTAKLEAISTALSSKLDKSDKAEAASFVMAQARWAEWRDAEAEYTAHWYAATGPALAAQKLQFEVIVTGNKAQLTEERVKRLEAILSNR